MRVGNNTQYTLRDAGLGALAVFFTQSASFLARQSAMKLHQGALSLKVCLASNTCPVTI